MEEYEALGLVGHVTAKSSPDYAMPGRLVHYVKLRFDDFRYFIEHFLFLESVIAAVYKAMMCGMTQLPVSPRRAIASSQTCRHT